MTNLNDYDNLLAKLKALATKDVVSPTVPVSQCAQEAEALIAWIGPDRAALEAVGIAPQLLDSLSARVGALRQAESNWNAVRFSKEEAQLRYAARAKAAFELLEELYRHMRFAFRGRPELTARLCPPPYTMCEADKIQALNNLAVLGVENLEPLAAAGLSMERLEEAAQASDDLSRLKGAALGERTSQSRTKDLRDRAFTYLKTGLDEVRVAGRFLFWKDENRLRGYRYTSKVRRGAKGQMEEAADETPADSAVAAVV